MSFCHVLSCLSCFSECSGPTLAEAGGRSIPIPSDTPKGFAPSTGSSKELSIPSGSHDILAPTVGSLSPSCTWAWDGTRAGSRGIAGTLAPSPLPVSSTRVLCSWSSPPGTSSSSFLWDLCLSRNIPTHHKTYVCLQVTPCLPSGW